MTVLPATVPAPAIDAAAERVVLRDTPSYRVTYYRRPTGPARLTIVFVSAGQAAPGAPVEEFRRTLDRMDTSVIFVLDRQARWYSHDETPEMWAELDAVARTYAHVAAIGESMGGCGAILAQKELTRVDRTLAFSPQHSILEPFVKFDHRYEELSRRIASHRYIHFSDAPDPSRCVVLFGNAEWRDYIHSAMFIGHGFRPLYVEGSGHNVAAFLKALPGNGLVRLVAALLDWNTPFDRAAVTALFPGAVGETGMYANDSFASEATAHNKTFLAELEAAFTQATGQALGPNLALGRPANQSSLSAWSIGATTEEDAGGAVRGPISAAFSFHTGNEPGPWWTVDLGRPCRVQEVRVFNYVADEAIMKRAALLAIAFSPDGATWQTVYERTSPAPFGGSDKHPLIWRPGPVDETRHVRIQALAETYLHLNQVQVFGQPVG